MFCKTTEVLKTWGLEPSIKTTISFKQTEYIHNLKMNKFRFGSIDDPVSSGRGQIDPLSTTARGSCMELAREREINSLPMGTDCDETLKFCKRFLKTRFEDSKVDELIEVIAKETKKVASIDFTAGALQVCDYLAGLDGIVPDDLSSMESMAEHLDKSFVKERPYKRHKICCIESYPGHEGHNIETKIVQTRSADESFEYYDYCRDCNIRLARS